MTAEKTLEQIIAETNAAADAADEVNRQHLVNLLEPYVQYRKDETTAKDSKDIIAKLFRDFLEKNPGEVLWAETSAGVIEAQLKTRKQAGREYDLLTLADKDPTLFERLLKTGCLRVDDAAVKRQGQQVGGAERYAFPQQETTYLDVKVRD